MNPIEALMETATPLQRKLLEGCRYVEETGCWEWVGNEHGGLYKPGHRTKSSVRKISFTEFVGPLFETDIPVQRCGNRKCICPTHMSTKKKVKNGKWQDKEECRKVAAKYNTRSDFQKANFSAYNAAHSNKWLDDICSHMDYAQLPNGYWTKERCAEIAIKFKSRADLSKYNATVYKKIYQEGWNDLLSHMVFNAGNNEHGHWTKERCAEEASKYQTIKEFRTACPSGYSAAHKKGYIEQICNHMVSERLPDGYWTKERCAEEASKYQTIAQLKNANSSMYSIIHRNGWADELLPKSSHGVRRGYWTKARCAEEALKYHKRVDFSRGSGSAYGAASKNGWLDDICSHMLHGHMKWTKEACRDESLKYNMRKRFEEGAKGAYQAARKNGWLDEFFPKPA